MKSLFRGVIERMMIMVKFPVSVYHHESASAVAAPVTLGRWCIHYDEKIIDRKIIQANEDHCGCCVVPKKEAETATVKNKSVVLYEKTEEYLVPYVM
jgi:hypothetical protein